MSSEDKIRALVKKFDREVKALVRENTAQLEQGIPLSPVQHRSLARAQGKYLGVMYALREIQKD